MLPKFNHRCVLHYINCPKLQSYILSLVLSKIINGIFLYRLDFLSTHAFTDLLQSSFWCLSSLNCCRVTGDLLVAKSETCFLFHMPWSVCHHWHSVLTLLFSLLDACGIFVDVFQLYGGVFSIDSVFSVFFCPRS